MPNNKLHAQIIPSQLTYKIRKEVLWPHIKDGVYSLDVDDKKNNGFLFFGIWYKQWIENGYPLCYSIRQQIQNDSEVRDIFLKHFPENENCSLSIISGVGEYEMDETAIGVISDKINTYVKECLELSRYSGSVD